MHFYFAPGPDTVVILNCFFISYILIAVISTFFQNARDLLAKLKRKEKLAKVTSKFESRVDLVPAKPAEKDVHWC